MELCKFNVLKILLASLSFYFTFANILLVPKLSFSARYKSVYLSENIKIQSEFEDIKELILMGKSRSPKGINYIPFSISLSSS